MSTVITIENIIRRMNGVSKSTIISIKTTSSDIRICIVLRAKDVSILCHIVNDNNVFGTSIAHDDINDYEYGTVIKTCNELYNYFVSLLPETANECPHIYIYTDSARMTAMNSTITNGMIINIMLAKLALN